MELYNRLRQLISDISEYTTKKDLLKAPIRIQKEYYIFREFLNEDKRYAPARMRTEFNKYKSDALAFKSEELGLNLTSLGFFDSFDRYTSSSKIIAKVTNAMIKHGVKLDYLHQEDRNIDIAYKRKGMRRVISFRIQNLNNLDFMVELDSNLFININGTAYNKNGLDFIHDYHNQSNDYINNLLTTINNQELFIFNY